MFNSSLEISSQKATQIFFILNNAGKINKKERLRYVDDPIGTK